VTPRLRFPGLSEAWYTTRLRELGIFKSGLGFPENEQGGQAGTPFFKVSDMNLPGNEHTMIAANHYVTDEQIQRLRYKPINSKSLIFAKVGAAIFLERKRKAQHFLIDNNMMAFTPAQNLDFEFCSQVFSRTRLSKFVQIGALPSYNGSDLGIIKVKIPSLPEQKKIADFLGAVDERVKLLQRRRDALVRYKTGMMQRLFDQSLRFTRDDGTAFPDWEPRDIGSIYHWIGTNSLSREMLTDELGTVQNIHYGDIHGKFASRFRQSVAAAPYVKHDALMANLRDEAYCQPGDVVIADASEDHADIGKAIEIVEVAPKSLVAGLHTYIARPKAGQIVLGFSGYLFQTFALRRQMMRIAQGISVLGISKPFLAKLNLNLPHSDEHRKIADALSALDDKIAAVSAQVTHMQSFKKGLLQQMFV
jgi:restriction endonuclease S subunit